MKNVKKVASKSIHDKIIPAFSFESNYYLLYICVSENTLNISPQKKVMQPTNRPILVE
jgi:hypothetical protein